MTQHEFRNKVDFYITNVCNLTCDHCNRFNNHDFRGWQNWDDYREIYTQWSRLVRLKSVTIMGGEPFLNPSLPAWIQGINDIFGIDVQVLTNGTRFRHSARVYEALVKTLPRNGVRNHIGVSMHNPEQWEALRQDILDFLAPGAEIRPKGQNIWNSDWNFTDSNGIQVNVYTSNQFMHSAIIPLPPDGKSTRPRFTLHESNPDHAHENCAFAKWKSYHFIRGKLYKCGPVALLPEFHAQYPLDISIKDIELLHAYKPLTVDNYADYAEEFFDRLDQPIPQCRFCSTHPTPHNISPMQKKMLKIS